MEFNELDEINKSYGLLDEQNYPKWVREELKNYWQSKHVLITGGSRGLGLFLTKNLLDLGAKVAIVARDPIRLQLVKEQLNSENLLTLNFDIGNKETIHTVASMALSFFEGRVDYLINNASTLGGKELRPLLDTPCEDIEHALNVNVVAPFRLTKLVVPAMLGKGTVVNITSDASVTAYETWGAYSISKAALDHMTRIMAKEFSKFNIEALAFDPGDMRTTLHFNAIPDAEISDLLHPGDVALELIVFLAMEKHDQERYAASCWKKVVKDAVFGTGQVVA